MSPIALGLLYAVMFAVRASRTGAFTPERQNLCSGILIGLELLIAADIVHTVAIAPTLKRCGFGLVEVIGTFLSGLAQPVELDGH